MAALLRLLHQILVTYVGVVSLVTVVVLLRSTPSLEHRAHEFHRTIQSKLECDCASGLRAYSPDSGVRTLSDDTLDTVIDKATVHYSCKKRSIGSFNCPKLFLIGTQKAGTTTFANWVQRHPRIRFGNSTIKEMHFFSDLVWRPPGDKAEFTRRSRLYVESFGKRYHNATIGLDCTPSYLLYADIPRLMRESGIADADTRFLVILREPVDRFISSLNMAIRIQGYNMTLDRIRFPRSMPHRRNTSISIEEFALSSLEHIKECRAAVARGLRSAACEKYFQQLDVKQSLTLYRSVYVDQLSAWLRYFDPSQICVMESKLVYADLKAALRKRAQRCLNDVGLDVRALPRVAERANIGRYSFPVDRRYPRMRRILNRELFEEANAELAGLLKEKWGIVDFDL